jgi:hypothetical protein
MVHAAYRQLLERHDFSPRLERVLINLSLWDLIPLAFSGADEKETLQ